MNSDDKSRDKYLNKVVLSSDVYSTCLLHALTTEKEEIMGLLIGEIDEEECISRISCCVILHRSDKQPDRVEISPEQLTTAASYAEELASKLNKPLRVIGWYHSHPHITVWPSHVDLRTQATYQMMDPLFVGLIFSVYQKDSGSTGNKVELTCFQACQKGSEYQRREIKFVIENTPFPSFNLNSIANLPRILSQEEVQSHDHGNPVQNHNGEGDFVDELAVLHNDAFKTVAMVHIVSKVAKPVYEDLEAKLESAKLRIAELKELRKKYKEEIETMY